MDWCGPRGPYFFYEPKRNAAKSVCKMIGFPGFPAFPVFYIGFIGFITIHKKHKDDFKKDKARWNSNKIQ